MFDYGCFPLWSVDEKTKEAFGYLISDLSTLGLSSSTIKIMEYNCEMFDNYLNPIYHGFPSFWSGRMYAFFQFSIKHLFQLIEQDIGKKYVIENHELIRFNEEIDIESIDLRLKQFVEEPLRYALKKGISFGSAQELKLEVQEAYQEWENKEYKYYTI